MDDVTHKAPLRPEGAQERAALRPRETQPPWVYRAEVTCSLVCVFLIQISLMQCQEVMAGPLCCSRNRTPGHQSFLGATAGLFVLLDWGFLRSLSTSSVGHGGEGWPSATGTGYALKVQGTSRDTRAACEWQLSMAAADRALLSLQGMLHLS